jgi:hypothetical protein
MDIGIFQQDKRQSVMHGPKDGDRALLHMVIDNIFGSGLVTSDLNINR